MQQNRIAWFSFRGKIPIQKQFANIKWRHNLDIPTDIWVMCINPIDLNETNITQSQLSRKQDTPRDPSNLPQIRCWKCFGIRSVATRFANSKFTSQIQPTGSFFFGLPRIHLFHVSQFPLVFSRNDNRKSKMSPPKIGIGYDKHHGPFQNPIDHQFGSSLWPPWKRSDPIHWPEQCWIRQVLVCMPKVVQLSWFFLSNMLLSIANVGQQTAL